MMQSQSSTNNSYTGIQAGDSTGATPKHDQPVYVNIDQSHQVATPTTPIAPPPTAPTASPTAPASPIAPVAPPTALPIVFAEPSNTQDAMQTINDDPNYMRAMYDRQMKCSLCIMVTCLICCNFFSLIFTVPAVICSWMAIQANMEDRPRDAYGRRNTSFICVSLAVFQFIIIMLLLVLAAAVYALIATDVIEIDLN